MGALRNLAPAKPLTGLSWVSGLAQGAAVKESPFVAVVLGWLRLHLRYATSEGALDAVGGPYRRIKPFPSFPYPQPTTRILSHPTRLTAASGHKQT